MSIDYYKISEITVKSQNELDMIPDDYKGRIYIEFGTRYNKAVINRRFNSSVEAWENSSVVARENSSVVATGNVQVVDRLYKGRLEITGNARVVYMPKTIEEFMNFYGIKHDKKKAIFFKAVHKTEKGSTSDYNSEFNYSIGETIKEECDPDVEEDCGCGIHIANYPWCLDFGNGWSNLTILEVEVDIDKIILPKSTNGKVRTSEIKVIREVPLTECGIYGKILAKRNKE